ncbi:hypothetical protein HZS_2701, partial [Henneguya salminicola]
MRRFIMTSSCHFGSSNTGTTISLSSYTNEENKNKMEIAIDRHGNKKYIDQPLERTSSLLSPIMLLSGHSGELYTCRFHPSGSTLVSAGHDKNILVWNTFGECENIAALRAHKGAVTEISFSYDGERMLTSSVDKTVGLWDYETGVRVDIIVMNIVRMWDIYPYCEGDRCIKMFFGHTHNFEKNLLRCCFSPDSKYISSGSGDSCVYIWDCVTRSLLYKLPGHE